MNFIFLSQLRLSISLLVHFVFVAKDCLLKFFPSHGYPILYLQIHYLMCLSANYAHIRDHEKFQDLQELKYLQGSDPSIHSRGRYQDTAQEIFRELTLPPTMFPFHQELSRNIENFSHIPSQPSVMFRRIQAEKLFCFNVTNQFTFYS